MAEFVRLPSDSLRPVLINAGQARILKKFRLNPEELRVDQFQVEPTRDEDGTVIGHATTAWYSDPCLYCPNEPLTYSCYC